MWLDAIMKDKKASKSTELPLLHLGGGNTLYTFRDKKGAHRWRIRDKSNKKIIADGGQGYSRYVDMFGQLAQLFGTRGILEEGAQIPSKWLDSVDGNPDGEGRVLIYR